MSVREDRIKIYVQGNVLITIWDMNVWHIQQYTMKTNPQISRRRETKLISYNHGE